MRLLIGNKNYSSWSMRPWLVLSHFGIEFKEEILWLSGDGWKDKLRERSPTGNVPVLMAEQMLIPDSLAIIEYLNDRFPEKNIWPEDRMMRARARAAACEIHCGFHALRNAAPMNIRASMPGRVDVSAIQGDLDRLNILLGGLLERSGGPFLCGEFSAADAMYAPVAMRILSYQLPVSEYIQNWIEALSGVRAVQAWRAAALTETQIVHQDELDAD